MNEQSNNFSSNNDSLNNTSVIPNVPIITPDMVQSNITQANNNELLNNQNNNISNVNLENTAVNANFINVQNNNVEQSNVNSNIINSGNIVQSNPNVVDTVIKETIDNNNQNFVNNLQDSSVSSNNENVGVPSDQLGFDSLYVPNSVQNENLGVNLQTNNQSLSNESVSSVSNEVFQNNVQEQIQTPAMGMVNNIENNDNANYQNNNINLQNNNSYNDDLVKIYVGEKYDKIKSSSFSLPGFFFGISYLLYRKMYLYAFLALLASPLGIVFNILLGIFINKWYLSFSSKKVEKIKTENSGKSIDEIKVICSKKGGTSVGAVILGTLLMFVIIFVVMLIVSLPLIFNLLSFSNDITEKNDLSNSDLGNNVVNNEYNGVISSDTSIVIDDVFEVNIPEEFKDYSFGDYEYRYEFFDDSSSSFLNCEFSLSAVMGYNSAEKLSGEMSIEISEKTINNIKWYNFVDESIFSIDYYYLTEQDGKVYLYKFLIDEEYLEVCEPYHESLINSIKFK